MIYELREYTVLPGRMDNLRKLFHYDMPRLLAKHEMLAIGYWNSKVGKDVDDVQKASDELEDTDKWYYMIAFQDLEELEAKWHAFHTDPEWLDAIRENRKDGANLAKTRNYLLYPTPFSPLK